ncbi:AAA family ATPase [Demequina aurantiaca]|uniref:AAA family ATPase n=1 Tax=Demequina aurantiaca TaxID=676200 RepID=UPI003D3453E2
MTDSPLAILMTGAPASGKSTTAAELARITGAAVLDQDSMTNPLVDVIAGVTGAADYGDPRVAALTRDARYECLLQVACDCLRSGVSVILIAPFTSERADPAAWERLEARLADAGGGVRMVWIRLHPDVIVERLVSRGAARDAGKISDTASYLATLNLEAPVAPHHEVDGTLAADAQAARIAAALDAPST